MAHGDPSGHQATHKIGLRALIPNTSKNQVKCVFQQDILLVQQLQNIQISERHTLFLSWHSFISGNYSRHIYRTVNIPQIKTKTPKELPPSLQALQYTLNK